MQIPETHFTVYENGDWQLFHRGIPCTNTTTYRMAAEAAKQMRLTPSNMVWSAQTGQFIKLEESVDGQITVTLPCEYCGLIGCKGACCEIGL